jgi:hypothetical protein
MGKEAFWGYFSWESLGWLLGFLGFFWQKGKKVVLSKNSPPSPLSPPLIPFEKLKRAPRKAPQQAPQQSVPAK